MPIDVDAVLRLAYDRPSAEVRLREPSLPKFSLRDVAVIVARKHGVPPDMFERLIEKESRWDPEARSPSGAVGIAQIIPRYHPTADLKDPHRAMDYAAWLLRRYRDRFGSWERALAAYNMGPTAVLRGRPWPPETRAYIRAILGAKRDL